MASGHTHERIIKLFRMGLSLESIAKKIGRPGDIARVKDALKLEGIPLPEDKAAE